MRIEVDDLTRPEVHALLSEHLANMYELSPPEQVFALDLSKLKAPDITFWTAWQDNILLGCGALKELNAMHGEVKSMRTPSGLRNRGAGRAVLDRIVETARQRGYALLSLETGTHPAFLPAQQLYRSAGFQETGPFAGYEENPHSLFMELRLIGTPGKSGEANVADGGGALGLAHAAPAARDATTSSMVHVRDVDALCNAAESASPKYSLPEIERRWLVPSGRMPALAHAARRTIEDKYIDGGRLRLRAVHAEGADAVYKLGKKYPGIGSAVEQVVSIYLTAQEHLTLAALPGAVARKSRYAVEGGSLDVYEVPAAAPSIFEVEFGSAAAAAAYLPPAFAGEEITRNDAYTGYALASAGRIKL